MTGNSRSLDSTIGKIWRKADLDSLDLLGLNSGGCPDHVAFPDLLLLELIGQMLDLITALPQQIVAPVTPEYDKVVFRDFCPGFNQTIDNVPVLLQGDFGQVGQILFSIQLYPAAEKQGQ